MESVIEKSSQYFSNILKNAAMLVKLSCHFQMAIAVSRSHVVQGNESGLLMIAPLKVEKYSTSRNRSNGSFLSIWLPLNGLIFQQLRWSPN